MPRMTKEIIDQADELARKFEDHVPDPSEMKEAATLRRVREAFPQRAAAEQVLSDAVASARQEEQSWGSIGAMLGTSGEAARQRYGTPATKR